MCSSVYCSMLTSDIQYLSFFYIPFFFFFREISKSISTYYMQLGLSTSSSSISSSQGRYGYLSRQASGGNFACARTRRGSLLNPSLISTSASSISAHHHGQEVLTTKPRHGGVGGDGEYVNGDEGYSSSSIKIHLSNLEKLFPNANRGCLSPLPPPQPSPPADFPINSEQQFMTPILNKGKDFLKEGLMNLTRRIWQTETNDVVTVGEELSPRNKLNHLQQQLLMSAATTEYSPRNHLGSRWMEYHGSKDWVGLLDPLDENLRREVVRYGEFVQAAYQAFHTNPDSPAGERLRHHNPHVALPDSSYKVTKSLYATSSVGLPGWVENVAPESLEWMTQRSSWIGYVAVCDDMREIERMGRRDIVIALRGTATCLEWVENLRDLLVRIHDDDKVDKSPAKQGQLQAKVECGFWSLYKTSGISNSGNIIPSLSESVTQEVARLMELYKGEKLSITVTGHSLGAALSVLAAEELSRKLPNPPPPIAVFSFGGPRVGNRGLANRIKEKGIVKVLRVVNSQDMITKVPGMFVSEELDHKIRTGGGGGSAGSDDDDYNNSDKTKEEVGGGLGKVVLDILDNNMPWAYWHVGSELRVDSKRSPYLKPNADVACCHDLEAYLHLVDGFLASDCPFRENAKRSLVRLLTEQGSNVDKKLYTSKPPKTKTEALNLRHLHKGSSRSIGGGGGAVLLRMPSCLASPS